MTTRVTLNCQIAPEKLDKLIVFLKQNLPNVRNFAGNIRVDIFFDQARQEMLIDEDWKSIKYPQEYNEFITENGIMDSLISYFLAPPSMKYFTHQEI